MHFGKLLLSHMVVEKQQSPGGKCMLLSQFTAPKKVRGPETAVGVNEEGWSVSVR